MRLWWCISDHCASCQAPPQPEPSSHGHCYSECMQGADKPGITQRIREFIWITYSCTRRHSSYCHCWHYIVQEVVVRDHDHWQVSSGSTGKTCACDSRHHTQNIHFLKLSHLFLCLEINHFSWRACIPKSAPLESQLSQVVYSRMSIQNLSDCIHVSTIKSPNPAIKYSLTTIWGGLSHLLCPTLIR